MQRISILFIFLFSLILGAPIMAEASPPTKETESGLRIVDHKIGSGDLAESGKTVAVHYTGWLDNNGEKGNKFDSSVDRGTPFDFPLGGGRVIKGWDEGVAGMKVGGKRTLYIPSDLAYGARGFPPVIPANAKLIFDVELIEVKG